MEHQPVDRGVVQVGLELPARQACVTPVHGGEYHGAEVKVASPATGLFGLLDGRTEVVEQMEERPFLGGQHPVRSCAGFACRCDRGFDVCLFCLDLSEPPFQSTDGHALPFVVVCDDGSARPGTAKGQEPSPVTHRATFPCVPSCRAAML